MINKYNFLLKIDNCKIMFESKIHAERQFNISVRDNPKAVSIVLIDLYKQEIIAYKGKLK